jgi:1-deoxy-D-xylulose-5-phosphate reductoisomerase
LTFEKPDFNTFRNLALAFKALEKGGNMACILNAANEITVNAFLKDAIRFPEIAEINEACMEKVNFQENPSLDDFLLTDETARASAREMLNQKS